MRKKINKTFKVFGLVGLLSFGLSCSVRNINQIKMIKSVNKDVDKIKCYESINSNDISRVNPIIKEVEGERSYDKLNMRELKEYIQTPQQAQGYIDKYFTGHKNGCVAATVRCAYFLSDNNYPSLALFMIPDSNSNMGHSVFLYCSEKGFGALGYGSMEDRYNSIEDLVRSYSRKYDVSSKEGKRTNCRFSSYFVLDLKKLYSNNDWKNGSFDNVSTQIEVVKE